MKKITVTTPLGETIIINTADDAKLYHDHDTKQIILIRDPCSNEIQAIIPPTCLVISDVDESK